MEVHKATATDTENLLVTTNEALQFKISNGDTAWGKEPFTQEEIAAAISRGTTYVVHIDGEPAGRVTLTWSDERMWGEKGLDDKAGYIHSLAVRDAFRGQHVGEQIVDWCYAQIRQANRGYARLDCPADNEKLCGYYESQGFTRVGTHETGSVLYERVV